MIGNVTRRQPEFQLQCAVVQHLRLRALPGVFFAAIPNGEQRSKRTGARLKLSGVRAGCPDLLILVNGVPGGLELKAGKGRQSEEQRVAEDEWVAAGGRYAVARGIDDSLAVLEAWGALPATKARHRGALPEASVRQEAA